MRDELVLIFRMVRDGKLSGDEARRLVEALSAKPSGFEQGETTEGTARGGDGGLALGALLAMVAEGRLSPEAAVDRLEPSPRRADDPSTPGSAPRWVRIIVSDEDNGRSRVNVRLPMGVVNAGLSLMQMLPASSLQVNGRPIDLKEIVGDLRQAGVGQVFRVDAGRDHLEIVLE